MVVVLDDEPVAPTDRGTGTEDGVLLSLPSLPLHGIPLLVEVVVTSTSFLSSESTMIRRSGSMVLVDAIGEMSQFL